MDNNLFQFVLTAFVMLVVVVNPIIIAPIFVGVTKAVDAAARRSILRRAIIIAFCVALFFLLVGRLFLSYLGVSIYSFAISGGILLFVIAFPMLLGQNSSVHTPESDNIDPKDIPAAPEGDDVAIFPMAFPMLAGPGTIATVLVLAAQANNDPKLLGSLIASLAVVYLVSWLILSMSERIITKLGDNKMNIITRILGLILAALAVQYVLNGFTGYYNFLMNQK